MNLLLALLGIGVLAVGVIAFWAAIQNWLADLLNRTRESLGTTTHTAQNALVVLDRVIVNGQRLFVATLRTIFAEQTTQQTVSVEEVKTIARKDLPADILARLEAGTTLEYELSVGAMKVQNDPTTYRLVVRRAE